MSKYSLQIKKICLVALFLVLGWILPVVTGRIPEIGKMLLPMHLSVMLCGFILGKNYGLLIGFITPITRFLIFGIPVLYPTAICMMFELATYGFVCGLMIKIFAGKLKLNYLLSVIISLVIAMLVGRIIWALSRMLCGLFDHNYFTFKMFLAGGFVTAWPGITAQFIIIPSILVVLNKLKVVQSLNREKATNN